MSSIPTDLDQGAYVLETDNWDVQSIEDIGNKEELNRLLVHLWEKTERIRTVINIKSTGIYPLTEIVNSELLPPDAALQQPPPLVGDTFADYRIGFHKMIQFGPLPNTGTATFAHGINIPAGSPIKFYYIVGAANDLTNRAYIPLPYTSTTAAADNVSIDITSTHIVVNTETNRSSFTDCWIHLKYIKQ